MGDEPPAVSPTPTVVARTFARHAVDAVAGHRPPFVLCYHGIGEATPDEDPHGLLVSRETFTSHVDALLGAGYRLVTAGELWAQVAGGGPAAARGLGAITFDDGLADTMHAAVEILSRRGAAATAYLAPGLLGAPHPDLPTRRILDRAEVAPLAAAGIEIGAHSDHHADLSILRPELARAEVRRSRKVLQQLTGEPIAGMAYPYGRYNERTIASVREAGYSYACACAGAGPWTAYEVPREPVFPSTDVRRLRVKVAGLYGPVHELQRRRPG